MSRERCTCPAAGSPRRRGERIPAGTPVVVYCWGPGCNGATRAALEFALLGYPVKEMLGGFEYWVREGFAYDTADGLAQSPRRRAHERGTGRAHRRRR